MKDQTMKTKTLISILTLAINGIFAYAETPLVQALKVQKHLNDVKAAIQSRGVECPNLESMSNAVMQINDINQFASGKYNGKITVAAEAISWYPCKYVTGNYEIYAPNLKSTCNEAYRYASGLISFSAPELITPSTYLFADCTSLNRIDLPKCTAIKDYDFCNCTSLIGQYEFPSCTDIGECAFQNCNKITDIRTAPLKSVGKCALDGCSNLEYVDIDEDYCYFHEGAFKNCTKLKQFKWPKSYNYDKYAFYNCKSLTHIKLGSDIRTCIPEYSFYGCSGITNITLRNTQVLYGQFAFDLCDGVTDLICPELIKIGDYTTASDYYQKYVFSSMHSLTNIYMPKLAAIDHGQYTFAYCYGLKELHLPELDRLKCDGDLNRYVDLTFYQCQNLITVDLPRLTYIRGCETFKGCYSLKNVNLPSLSYIHQRYDGDSGTFQNCTSLEEISLPSLSNLRYCSRIFGNCATLKKINIPNLTTICRWDDSSTSMYQMFLNSPMIHDIYVGFKGADLLNYSYFPGSATQNAIFHCLGDAPYNVDVLYMNGKWQQMTNGTYKLVDYIKGNGTQYLNSGIKYKPGYTIYCDCELGSSTKQWCDVFGVRDANNRDNRLELYSNFEYTQKFTYYTSIAKSKHGSAYENGRYHIIANGTTCDIYNESNELIQRLEIQDAMDQESPATLGIFVVNRSTGADFSPQSNEINTNMKLYRFTVKDENNNILCDLVPALANDNIPCVVDLANNYHPHFNYGTGEFEYGSVTNENIIVNQ